MKKYLYIKFIAALVAAMSVSLHSCNGEKDLTPPVIDEAEFLPANCDIYYLGDTIRVRFVCEDDYELGNFNIEIHNNFDHHTHGTSNIDCEEDHEHGEGEYPSAENAWVYNHDFTIAHGLKCDTVDLRIGVPTDVQAGDYHFMLRLTDRAGWQTLKAVAIRLRENN